MKLTLPFRNRKAAAPIPGPSPMNGRGEAEGAAPPLGELTPANGVSLLGALSSFALPDDGLPGGYGVYRRMLHDPQVKACLNTKKFAVLSQGWAVHAASESPEDQAVAAFVRDALTQVRGGILDALHDVLDALALGVSLVEIIYQVIPDGPHAGGIGLKALKAKDPGGFTFETDAFANVTALRGCLGQTFPPDKFLLYSYMPQYESPLGQSDLKAAYRPWRVKQQMLRWWAKYLEKFGLPTVTGSYDAERGYGADQQRQLLSLVSQVHNESAIVLPSDMRLGLLETTRAAPSGFLEAVEYLDRAIAKSILGQTLTTDGSASGATFALGSVHQDVLLFYLRKLQRDLEETVIGAQLLAPLVRYNFGPAVPRPRFTLGNLDDGRLTAAGRLIADLVAGKVIAPDEPWIRGYLGLPAVGE
jgi:phage gp29-like protein